MICSFFFPTDSRPRFPRATAGLLALLSFLLAGSVSAQVPLPVASAARGAHNGLRIFSQARALHQRTPPTPDERPTGGRSTSYRLLEESHSQRSA